MSKPSDVLANRDENFAEYAGDIFSEEPNGENTLALTTFVVMECENCQTPLSNPVILLANSVAERDWAVVCKKNCTE